MICFVQAFLLFVHAQGTIQVVSSALQNWECGDGSISKSEKTVGFTSRFGEFGTKHVNSVSVDPCTEGLCKNGGTCKTEPPGPGETLFKAECTCTPFWTGEECQEGKFKFPALAMDSSLFVILFQRLLS